MQNDNFVAGKAAKAKLIAGFDKIADSVKITLGAAGANGVLEHHLYPFNEITNDGISIARNIVLADPFENQGANLAREIGARSDKQSGDGTTTAIVLAKAILHEGKDAEIAPMQLKRELEDCLPIIEASLKDQTKEITVDEVGTVASVSAEDPTIGAMIQEIYQKIGKDGILFRDISQTFNDHYTLGQGIRIMDAGFVSPYMAEVSQDGRMQPAAMLKNAPVLITKQKITSHKDLSRLGEMLNQRDIKELVIFCDEIESPLIPGIVMVRSERGFRFLIVKMPVLWKDNWFEDLAALTGATVVDPSAGVTLKTVGIQHLGEVGHITVDKNDTYIDGVNDITDHLAELGKDDSDEAKIRIARLNQKTARYFVGAPSDQALSYRKLKVEDACGAAWQALHGGICAGGGVALRNASEYMPGTIGGKILKRALLSPLYQIMNNAGALEGDFKIMLEEDAFIGWNARTGEPVNMFEAGIVDPSTVVFNSARNAISVAAMILTAGVVTVLPKQDARQPQMPLL